MFDANQSSEALDSRSDGLPAAVVFGATEMTLAIARSLAPRGVRVVAAHFAKGKPLAAYSRHLSLLNGPDVSDDDAVLDFLTELAKQFSDCPVLIPAQDQGVLFMHRHRDALRKCYRLYVWDSELLAESGSKRGLRRVAEQYGLPVPKTVNPRNAEDLEAILKDLKFPCIVKPEYTELWWTPEAVSLGLNRKAIRVDNADELRALYSRTERLGSPIVVQQMVIGPDSEHMSYTAFVAPDGSMSAELVARKVRIHPPKLGIGCFLRAEPVADALDIGRDIMRRLDFRGFASLQLKRDERDGRLYLIEINLRFPIWIGLPIACGADYPWHYYQTCRGRTFSPAIDVQSGTTWMNLQQDLQSMRIYARDGTWTWGQWLRDAIARPVPAIFRWTDPLPAIIGLMSRFQRVCHRRTPEARHLTHGVDRPRAQQR